LFDERDLYALQGARNMKLLLLLLRNKYIRSKPLSHFFKAFFALEPLKLEDWCPLYIIAEVMLKLDSISILEQPFVDLFGLKHIMISFTFISRRGTIRDVFRKIPYIYTAVYLERAQTESESGSTA
ncbi:hypothetical protein ACJX0J_005486, partial [Zea mays]